MLFLITAVAPKPAMLKIGMALCLGVAGYEFSQFNGNIWALLIVALSPLPFFVAIRQTRFRSSLVIVTILMLALGSFFLIGDVNGSNPHVNYGLAGLVSALCGRTIWIISLRIRDTSGKRLSDNPDSLVGLIGTARSAIENYQTGSVELNGELWVARSEQSIPVGSTVRIVRYDGLVLTVEKVENLTKNKSTRR
jgi:membrane-bound ClpP family serine protease